MYNCAKLLISMLSEKSEMREAEDESVMKWKRISYWKYLQSGKNSDMTRWREISILFIKCLEVWERYRLECGLWNSQAWSSRQTSVWNREVDDDHMKDSVLIVKASVYHLININNNLLLWWWKENRKIWQGHNTLPAHYHEKFNAESHECLKRASGNFWKSFNRLRITGGNAEILY
jgi:hypothetical protein